MNVNIINNIIAPCKIALWTSIPNTVVLIKLANTTSPSNTISISKCTELKYLLINITAIENKTGNIIPIASSYLASFDLPNNSTNITVKSPVLAAPTIKKRRT